MPHLSLSLLGPFQAALDAEPVLPSSARLQALLAYLVVETERAHSREALAGLLWPERSGQEAHTALRYAHQGDVRTARLHADIANNAQKEAAFYMSEEEYQAFSQEVHEQLEALLKK